MPPFSLQAVPYPIICLFFAEYCALWLLAKGQLQVLQVFIVTLLWACFTR